MENLSCAYAVIRKSDNMCFQILQTNNTDFNVDDDYAYSVSVDKEYCEQYLEKYYINGQWYERTWNEYDDDGNPVESSGYVDTPWEPGE